MSECVSVRLFVIEPRRSLISNYHNLLTLTLSVLRALAWSEHFIISIRSGGVTKKENLETRDRSHS